MNRGGINDALYTVISRPPAWATQCDAGADGEYFLTRPAAEPAGQVREKSLGELVASFLEATTDAVRLVRASRASHKILSEYDMAELEELRAKVQASELLRVISYSQQTDHSAHTLYLYLLGIYLFFACRPLRAEMAKFLGEPSESQRLLKRFLFMWAFVSLLHDIGYIFHGRSKNEIRAVDRMFRPSSIRSLIADEDYRQRVGEYVAEIEISSFEQIENPEDMLTLLRRLPWGVNAGARKDAFATFDMFGPKRQRVTADYLEDYAYRVASSGYNSLSEGMVDHAVASGLFLLSYSTFWHSMATDFKYKGPFQTYEFDYPMRDVVWACFATAAHNLIGVHASDLKPLVFETNPLLYLGVLCDELQKWDRFPAGQGHLVDLNSFEKHCTDSERIRVACVAGDRQTDEGGWDGEKVVFDFEESELAEKIKKTLEKRLGGFERFVQINPPPPAETQPPAGDGAGAGTATDGPTDATTSVSPGSPA
ncbi:MAG TPA: hypothetical protein VNZ44_17515 [Pyrinomonadaceae bacterium]|nr:hypothetical protein [Pyrinomonadaceae bacterium]